MFILVRFKRVPGFLAKIKEGGFTRIMSTAGIIAFAFAMLQFYDVALSSLITRFLRREEAIAPFTPLLPGVTISIELFLLLIPGIVIAIIVHELAHAVTARAEGLSIKSFGIAVFLGIIPGAFVELDENELQRANLVSRLRVYAAGTAANLATALVLMGLLALIMQGGIGFYILEVVEGSPADVAGIKPGSLILSVNNTVPRTFLDLRLLLANSTSVIVDLEHKGLTYRVNMTKGIDDKYGIIIGIVPFSLVSLVAGDAIMAHRLFNIIDLAMKINMALAVINAAPILITDGAKVIDALTGPRRRWISMIIQVATLLLLLLNLNLELIG